jgi:hypothetical protein
MAKTKGIDYWHVYPDRMWVLTILIGIGFGCLGLATLFYVVSRMSGCS